MRSMWTRNGKKIQSNKAYHFAFGRNTICQRKLKRVIKLIRENINSDKNNQKTFYFLQAISKIPDKTVERIIHQYNMDEHVYQGKGFAYLQQMIISGYQNEEKMLENEIRKFGRTPKKVKVERGEVVSFHFKIVEGIFDLTKILDRKELDDFNKTLIDVGILKNKYLERSPYFYMKATVLFDILSTMEVNGLLSSFAC